MHAPDDSGSSRQHALWLEDHVWRLHGRVQSPDRFVPRSPSSISVNHLDSLHFTLRLAERIAAYSFELITLINRDHFALVVRYGAFADLTVCMTEFCKITKYQKISLSAIEMLRGVVPAMLACPECALALSAPSSRVGSRNGSISSLDKAGSNGNKDVPPDAAVKLVESSHPPVDDPMVKYWFPVLFAFYDVIMDGDDLEVRRL